MTETLTWYPMRAAERMNDLRRIGLSLAAEGLLARMEWACWLMGPIPTEPGAVAMIVRADPAEVSALWPVIEPFLMLREGRATFEHLEVEREKSRDISDRNKSAAAKRWGSDDAPAMRAQCDRISARNATAHAPAMRAQCDRISARNATAHAPAMRAQCLYPDPDPDRHNPMDGMSADTDIPPRMHARGVEAVGVFAKGMAGLGVGRWAELLEIAARNKLGHAGEEALLDHVIDIAFIRANGDERARDPVGLAVSRAKARRKPSAAAKKFRHDRRAEIGAWILPRAERGRS